MSDIRVTRLELKGRLAALQSKIVPRLGYIPICPYCNKRPATDMHEALVKRSDVQSWPKEAQLLIYVYENCVVLCRECHEKHGQTSYMTKWFAEEHRQLIDLEAWLDSLPFKVTPRKGYVGGHSND